MSNLASDYDEKFYEYNVIGSLRSAKLVLGLLHDKFKFASVADLGCGRGTWLRASLDLGASRVLGYDGVWNEGKVDQNIDFISCDLENLDIDDERFDLAISLEVAEHLSEGKADQFIDALVKKSDAVVFASAFTRQLGTTHINEQFPSYWAEKFESRGYYPVDFFRPKIWGDTNIEPCYRQNTFLYVKKGNDSLRNIFGDNNFVEGYKYMNCMHPEIYLERSGMGLVNDFYVGIKRVIKSKFSRKIH